MSFLTSLLNPEPANEQASPPHQHPSPPSAPVQADSLPPIQYVQSPTQQQAPFPSHQRRESSQYSQYSYPPVTAQEAAQALASLSRSTTAGSPTQISGYTAPYGDNEHTHWRRASDARPGSSGGSYAGPIELPPPTTGRRLSSSPTLEQYHVASRSPEQRKMSIMQAPQEAGFTLPPIQHNGSSTSIQQEHENRQTPLQSSHIGDGSSPAVVQGEASGSNNGLTSPSLLGASEAVVEPFASQLQEPAILPIQPSTDSNGSRAVDRNAGSQTVVKEENMQTPPASSPIEHRSASAVDGDAEQGNLKPMTSLKSEHSMRNPSPLREWSAPMRSNEEPLSATSEQKEKENIKKRSVPAKTKKGTASVSKKAPPAKKRKVESLGSDTPTSRLSKVISRRIPSSISTPLDASPAPSTRSDSAEPASEAYEDDDDDDDEPAGSDDGVYCICRKPDTGTFMIGCDGECDDWFHGKCVGVEERNKHLIDKYICPNCQKAGIGRTTWKRLCRRSGCRQPARAGKSKGGESKYCSEECGVAYFREMASKSRGREEGGRARRKASTHRERTSAEDDLGAKGGVLSASEVKSLLNSSKTASDFKRLGEGVLSPPATPDGKTNQGKGSDNSREEYTESETTALQCIRSQKEEARDRHALLKDRMKFISLAKQAATRGAEEKGVKPKEYCGYDPRLEWTEAHFSRWRDSPTGKQAFELETLQTDPVQNGTGMEVDADEDADGKPLEICERKKCARHLDWAKLATDDLRFEMSDNGDAMRALEREEREIKERATMRGKVGAGNAEGSVEVHDVGVVGAPPVTNGVGGGEAMDVDVDVDVVKTESPAVLESVEDKVVSSAMAVDAAASIS